MSRMGKYLAGKKKSGVKASVDSALNVALATAADVDAFPDDSLKNSAAKIDTTDDWGADSDSGPVAEQTLSVGGGHFHLITEEDVSRKQQRKPRKWGEVTPEKSEEADVPKPENPKAEEPVKVELYRAKGGLLSHHRTLDISNKTYYPSLDDAISVNSSSASKKKEKKAETSEKGAKAINSEQKATDEIYSSSIEEKKEEGCLMLIEEFLYDIVKPQINNVVYDDECSRSKFIGRKKPRFNVIAGSHSQ